MTAEMITIPASESMVKAISLNKIDKILYVSLTTTHLANTTVNPVHTHIHATACDTKVAARC